MPYYDVTAVALALEIAPKQLDNLLSRNELDGVERKRRGVTRRITHDAAVAIDIAWRLSEGAQIPIASALDLSRQLATAGDHSLSLGEFVTLAVDFAALRASTLTRLDAAVEAVGRRPRGRPPKAGTRSPTAMP